MRWGKLRIRGLTHSRFAYNLCLRRHLTACESAFETLRRRTREEDPLRLQREHLPALHSPAGRDVISSQTRRATGGAHRERWRDRPCETAATGEAYRQALWQVPTPAEETPRDESKDVGDEGSLHRAGAKHRTEGG